MALPSAIMRSRPRRGSIENDIRATESESTDNGRDPYGALMASAQIPRNKAGAVTNDHAYTRCLWRE